MMLAVVLLLVGCGNADSKDTEASTQQTESQSTSETETLEADTESSAASETTETATEVESETATEVESETTTEVESEVTSEVESEAPMQTESEAPQPSEEPSEPEAPQKPQYTYTDLSKTMYVKSSVNVRSLPSTDGDKLGGLSKTQEVHVTGQCNETGWYRIEFNGGTGYVSSSYLLDEKPVEKEPTQSSESEEQTPQRSEWEVKALELYHKYGFNNLFDVELREGFIYVSDTGYVTKQIFTYPDYDVRIKRAYDAYFSFSESFVIDYSLSYEEMLVEYAVYIDNGYMEIEKIDDNLMSISYPIEPHFVDQGFPMEIVYSMMNIYKHGSNVFVDENGTEIALVLFNFKDYE